MLPQNTVEIVLWIFVSITAGICEEFTFRGYLQMQLSGLLKNATAGLVLQGIVFGVAHAYQGPKQMFINRAARLHAGRPGAMVEEYTTGNDVAFSAGYGGRDPPRRALED